MAMMRSSDLLHRWSVADSLETYSIRDWGSGFFGINNKGHIEVTPAGPGRPAIDLKDLVDDLGKRGIATPLLIRFSDIVRSRIIELNESFRRAMAEYGYKGEYKAVYPIKVNQHRFLVEEICDYGKWEESGGDRSKFGLTAREMVDAIAYLRENEMLEGFQLLHFHLGSQISAIRSVKNALREAGRFYTELVKMGAPLRYLDCGGG